MNKIKLIFEIEYEPDMPSYPDGSTIDEVAEIDIEELKCAFASGYPEIVTDLMNDAGVKIRYEVV